jgi:NAD(P) transhydrogenase
VHFHWRERVVRCDASVPGVLTLMLSSDASIAADGVLVAAGRVSNTADLGLDAAGLVAGDRGLLKVNESYQTAVPHIYAAGDVIGSPALASTGMEQARLAMRHAFAVADTPAFPRILPTGIYTIPEVSAVGETEASLARQGLACIVGRAGYSENARGEIIGDDTGFLKLIFARDDMRLLGVHVLGEHATELVHIGLVAMMCGAGVSLFESACFNFPTLGDLYTRAAYDALLAAGIVRSDAL